MKSRNIDYKRATAATAENIHIFFDRFDSEAVRSIPKDHVWNTDEMGLMEGVGDNGVVLGDALKKLSFNKDAGKRTWTTVVEAISAGGRVFPPLPIFPSKDVQQQWFSNRDEEDFIDWTFTTSPNGWTSHEIALKWLKEVFIPFSKPSNPDQWRLLVLDGHSSHITEEFMWNCCQNKRAISIGGSEVCVLWMSRFCSAPGGGILVI